MWYAIRTSLHTRSDLVSVVTELLLPIWRGLIVMTGAICLIMAIALLPMERGWSNIFFTLIIILVSAVAFWLLHQHILAAQAVWQIGLAAIITFALLVYRHPEIAFAYTLLPLLAAITVGFPGALLAEGSVIALVWLLPHSSVIPYLPSGYGPGIVLIGAFMGMLGWTATHSLLTVTNWALFSYEQAREKVEEARNQRMELEQVHEDLTQANRELARLSDRLKAMHQVAEEARQAKEQFVANVSHELRTPLNMIIGFSEMIPQSSRVYGIRLPPALLADISAIRRNSEHLAKLVDDVLDLSQIDAGRMALSKEPASLQDIIDAAVTAVRALFESKRLYLETELAPDLPQVFCDSTRIRQVVLNLLSNAGRFTEQGGVRIKAWSEKDAVLVSVTDTGPGIRPEDQDRIFEPFQQLDGSIRRRHGGSGLGLSISKRFVEMHEGKIWLESEQGVGTTFCLSLPLETPVPIALARGGDAKRWFSPYLQYEQRTRRSKAPAPIVIPRFVLLEKKKTLGLLFDRYLHGFETVSVKDVDTAIEELSRSPAQALIVNAPSLQDVSVSVDRLTNLPYGTPAVRCWVPGGHEAAKELGVVRYLVKPVTRAALLSALDELGADVKSVLLVDDEPEVLQLYSRMLAATERSYRILRATGGKRALSLLRARQPDVMLLDLIMPQMDGFQVLEEKRQDPSIRDIPVAVVTSRDPFGEPVASDTLTVFRGGGLSVPHLLGCLQAISQVLVPSTQSAARERTETPVA